MEKTQTLKFLSSMFFACICLSKNMALLISYMVKKNHLQCPYCDAKKINPALSDYFIPTIGRYSCPECGKRYHTELRHGLSLLFLFLILLLVIYFLIPDPWCYVAFPVECLLITFLGIITYKPIKGENNN